MLCGTWPQNVSIAVATPNMGACPVMLYMVCASTSAERSVAPRRPTKAVMISSFAKVSTSMPDSGQDKLHNLEKISILNS